MLRLNVNCLSSMLRLYVHCMSSMLSLYVHCLYSMLRLYVHCLYSMFRLYVHCLSSIFFFIPLLSENINTKIYENIILPVSPTEIIPIPKSVQDKKRVSRKRGKTAGLTSLALQNVSERPKIKKRTGKYFFRRKKRRNVEEKQKNVTEFPNISATSAMTMIMMPSAYTVKTSIRRHRRLHRLLHMTQLGPQSCTGVHSDDMRLSVSALNAYLRFLRYRPIETSCFYFSLIAFLLQNNTLKYLIFSSQQYSS
jgi:hypothetical protein